MTGQTVSHYRILEKIGEGGMGVVYKAVDTHLDRFVALKLLPSEKTTDPERIRRFVQEAKAASALNHPNIVTIYDIDTSGGNIFISMEYIEGRTLEQWMRSHPALSDILKYTAQIASALSAAHSKGIIHRDIKPSNLMISNAGLAKVLDFGLAKLSERAPVGDDASTLTVRVGVPPATADDRIVGTVSYMSPEQAQGKKLDARSDIFTFGAVLYEMVSGCRAFSGDTAVATLAAILKTDPRPLPEITSSTPSEVGRIVARCLRKDPDKRFQHMDDLKVALEELREEWDSGKLPLLVSATPLQTAGRWRWIAGLTLVAAISVATSFWFSLRRAEVKPASGPVLTRLTSDTGLTLDPTFWPQGNLLAYASDRAGGRLDIYVQQLGGGEAHRLTSNEADDHEPNFSPDGTRIVFRSERDGGGLYIAPALGGVERKIADRGRYPKFSPDGKWIAYWDGEPAALRYLAGKVYVMPSSGGSSKQVAERATPAVWSPDSRRLLYAGDVGNADFRMGWLTTPVEGGAALLTNAFESFNTQKLESYLPAAWTAEGITFQAALGETVNIWRTRISADFKVLEPPRRLTFGSSMDIQPAVAGNRIIFTEMTENADIWTIPIDTNRGKLQGEPQQITKDLSQDLNCSISADGNKIVYSSRRGSNEEVMIADLATGKSISLATISLNMNRTSVPRISADGARVAYRTREGTFVIPVAGGVVEKVCDQCGVRNWAGDNRQLLVDDGSFLDLATGQTQRLISGIPKGSWGPGINGPRTSWDDRWIAFYKWSHDGGRTGVWIAPIRLGTPSEPSEWILISNNSVDTIPEFSPDGSRLYVLSQRDGGRCLWVQKLDATTKQPVGNAEPVYHFHDARRSPIYNKSGTNAASVARNKVALPVTERLGNIWMAELTQ